MPSAPTDRDEVPLTLAPSPVTAAALTALWLVPSIAAPPPARAAADRVATRLPLISITAPTAIRNEPKVDARMRVIDRRGSRLNRPELRANVYDGRIAIEHRGQMSQSWPKKSFLLETRTSTGKDRKVSLLGMPRDGDWVLHASHADRSLLRNALAFAAARRLGAYAARTRHVELLLNGRYQGVYVLMERLELNEARVRAPDGTLLLEMTQPDADDTDPTVTAPVTGTPVGIVDAGDKVSGEERERALEALARVESALFGPLSTDPVEGWRRWLDERSAVDFVLVQELFRNQDVFWKSTHMRLLEDGIIHLGPVWDFDLSSGNVLEQSRMAPEGWQTADRPWGAKLFEDPGFRTALAVRWRALRAQGLLEFLQDAVDRRGAALRAPAARNFRRWPVLRTPVLAVHPPRASHAEELAALRDWLTRRAAWLDATMVPPFTRPAGSG
jgi:hypothetical protein